MAASLKRRVDLLEKGGAGFKPYRQIIQEAGQTQEEAISAHEAENGPLGDVNLLIVRICEP